MIVNTEKWIQLLMTLSLLQFNTVTTTAVAQLVECSLRMWEVGVRIPAGSDQDFKNGSDCSFAKHSAIRNESHGSFGRDFKPRSRVTAGVAR